MREKERKKEAWQVLLTERACRNPFSFKKMCRSVDTLCLLGMSDSLLFKRAVVLVYVIQKVEEGWSALGWDFDVAGRSGSFLFFSGVHRFSSHRRTGTGVHVACLSNLNKTKTIK